MTDLKNKVALVTGSARGVGRAIALRYGSLGADVVVNYSSDEKNAQETVDTLRWHGAKAIAVKGNVAQATDVENLFAVALKEFAKIDIVVVNAGIELIDQPMLEATEADFDRLFAVNSKGTFFTLQSAGRHVANNGRIIYIGSSTTALPVAGVGLYGGSKMAPRLWVQVLASEIGHRGITVNAIIPTALDGAGVFTHHVDEAFRKMMIENCPMGRMGTAEDVANAAEYFAGPLSGFVSGQCMLVTGGAPY